MSSKKIMSFVLLIIIIIIGIVGLLVVTNNFLEDSNSTIFTKNTKNYPYILVNQLGYKQDSPKRVFVQTDLDLSGYGLILIDNSTGNEVASYTIGENSPLTGYNFKNVYQIDFSDYNTIGTYYFKIEEVTSPVFKIGITTELLDIAHDSLFFHYINQDTIKVPGWHDSCHLDDGIIDNGPYEGDYINLTGGWFDAGDYLKFTRTTADTLLWFLFTIYENKEILSETAENPLTRVELSITDSLQEQISMGLKYLNKTINSVPDSIVIVVGNETDHFAGNRLPEDDTITDRPITVTEDDEGANLAGRISAVYSLAYLLADVLDTSPSGLTKDNLYSLALQTYNFGKGHLGIASISPFYEENNYLDEMALGAILTYFITENETYLDDAISFNNRYWKDKENTDYVSNAAAMAAYLLAKYALEEDDPLNPINANDPFDYIESFYYSVKWNSDVMKEDPYRFSWPIYFWGSATASVKNAILGLLFDRLDLNPENVDWIDFTTSCWDYIGGINPWGYSFITGYGSIYPKTHHHQMALLLNKEIIGAMALGGAAMSVLEDNNLSPPNPDPLEIFQSKKATFYPTFESYVNNEPTIESNAALFAISVFLFSNH